MKRLALVLAAVALTAPAAAHAAACSPLNCAASQFTLAHGTLMGFRAAAGKPVNVVDLRTGKTRFTLPAGVEARNVLVHLEGQTVEWYDLTTGAKTQSIDVGMEYTLDGVSQDGSRAVLQQSDNGGATFLVVSNTGQKTVHVDGKQWDFDALHGDNLFLIHYMQSGGYEVRLAHVASAKLDAGPLKDPHESGLIWGSPFARLASSNGQYLFTLYIGSNGGAMIHELDTAHATARCIDLPGTGDYGAATTWTMQQRGNTLWAVNPRYGRVVAIDTKSRKVTRAFRITLDGWFLGKGTSGTLAPDGTHYAVADGESVAVVDLAARKVASRTPARAIAVGYSPDGANLWRFF
jgi:DNA-binding beta-propeller fold protein YncE